MAQLRVIVEGAPGIGEKPAAFVGLEDQHGYPISVIAWSTRPDGRYEARLDLLDLVFRHTLTTPTDVRNAVLTLSAKFADIEASASAHITGEEREEAHHLVEEGLTRVHRAVDIVAKAFEDEHETGADGSSTT